MRLHHAHTRDSSLRRLTLANRWLIAGSVALTGVLTEVAAQAFPGKAKASSTKNTAQSGKAHSKTHGGSSPASTQKSITPPTEAPQSSSEPSAEAASEPTPEASAEPTPEATQEPAPEASASESSSSGVESSGSSAPSESSAPAVEESSAPVVSGGS